tara:strand:- start:1111 stop:1248 length:138 start_codon:yes stop_codon:yes gene_type:complete
VFGCFRYVGVPRELLKLFDSNRLGSMVAARAMIGNKERDKIKDIF